MRTSVTLPDTRKRLSSEMGPHEPLATFGIVPLELPRRSVTIPHHQDPVPAAGDQPAAIRSEIVEQRVALRHGIGERRRAAPQELQGELAHCRIVRSFEASEGMGQGSTRMVVLQVLCEGK